MPRRPLHAAAYAGALAVASCLVLATPGSAGIGLAATRDQHPNAAKHVKPVGKLETVAGSLGTGSSVYVAQQPVGVAISSNGDVIVTDDGSSLHPAADSGGHRDRSRRDRRHLIQR